MSPGTPAGAAQRLRGVGGLAWAERSILGPLCLVVFVSLAYFVGPPAWNQNSRFALTRAMVERGALDIDQDHHTTGDKSFRDGHFYSDKAPGSSLLAALPHAITMAIIQVSGAEKPGTQVRPYDPLLAEAGQVPDMDRMQPGDRLIYNKSYRVAQYIARVCSTSLLAVLGVLAMWLLVFQLTNSRRQALWVSVAASLATPAFAYGAALYGHQSCAVFLLVALALTVTTQSSTTSPEPSFDRATPLLVGTCLGWAVLCEYPAAIPVVLLVVFATARRGLRFGLWVALGGLPWALVLAAYHTLAFGGPLQTGYDFVYLEEFAEGMRVAYGIHAPEGGVLLELLFGRFRGLFYLSPVLMLAAWGLAHDLYATTSSRLGRPLAGVCLGIVAYYLVLNSGYYMWDGGAALGPRHCVPMLPFLALGLVAALPRAPRTSAALVAISLISIVVGTSAGPEAAQAGDPLYNFAWPRLWSATPGTEGGPTNLGLMLGLPGVLSLVPLLALWLGLGTSLWHATGDESRGP